MQRETRLNRRHFLVGVASTAGAAILAACGGGSATTAPTTAPTAAAKATTAPAAPRIPRRHDHCERRMHPAAAGSTTAAASTTGGVIATAAPAIAANTKFKLTVAIKNNSPAEVDLMQKVVDLYKADRPNADVAVLGYDNATYDQKLLTDISAGTLPDVFTCNDVYNKPFFQNGLIADLKPLAAKTGFKLDDFDPQFLGLADYQGKIGFLPRAADVVVLYYNKRIFDDAKVDVPQHELDDERSADHVAATDEEGGGWHHHPVRLHGELHDVVHLGADRRRGGRENPLRRRQEGDLRFARGHPRLELHLRRPEERLVRAAIRADDDGRAERALHEWQSGDGPRLSAR